MFQFPMSIACPFLAVYSWSLECLLAVKLTSNMKCCYGILNWHWTLGSFFEWTIAQITVLPIVSDRSEVYLYAFLIKMTSFAGVH